MCSAMVTPAPRPAARSVPAAVADLGRRADRIGRGDAILVRQADRKSTRLNSSHVAISYAVFCLKKKTKAIPLHPFPRRDSTHGSEQVRVGVTDDTAMTNQN